jgi:hypothetical protein
MQLNVLILALVFGVVAVSATSLTKRDADYGRGPSRQQGGYGPASSGYRKESEEEPAGPPVVRYENEFLKSV